MRAGIHGSAKGRSRNLTHSVTRATKSGRPSHPALARSYRHHMSMRTSWGADTFSNSSARTENTEMDCPRFHRCSSRLIRFVGITPNAWAGSAVIGWVDGVTVHSDGTITVRGWAATSDSPTAHIGVRVLIDGHHSLLSFKVGNDYRPDVPAVIGSKYSSYLGYTKTVPAPSGTHTVCVEGQNNGVYNVLSGCRTYSMVSREHCDGSGAGTTWLTRDSAQQGVLTQRRLDLQATPSPPGRTRGTPRPPGSPSRIRESRRPRPMSTSPTCPTRGTASPRRIHAPPLRRSTTSFSSVPIPGRAST